MMSLPLFSLYMRTLQVWYFLFIPLSSFSHDSWTLTLPRSQKNTRSAIYAILRSYVANPHRFHDPLTASSLFHDSLWSCLSSHRRRWYFCLLLLSFLSVSVSGSCSACSTPLYFSPIPFGPITVSCFPSPSHFVPAYVLEYIQISTYRLVSFFSLVRCLVIGKVSVSWV